MSELEQFVAMCTRAGIEIHEDLDVGHGDGRMRVFEITPSGDQPSLSVRFANGQLTEIYCAI